MGQYGFSQSDLADVLKSAPRASEIMSRKRRLTMSMARALHREWDIPAEVLIADDELRR